jgi:hypothetical protein
LFKGAIPGALRSILSFLRQDQPATLGRRIAARSSCDTSNHKATQPLLFAIVSSIQCIHPSYFGFFPWRTSIDSVFPITTPGSTRQTSRRIQARCLFANHRLPVVRWKSFRKQKGTPLVAPSQIYSWTSTRTACNLPFLIANLVTPFDNLGALVFLLKLGEKKIMAWSQGVHARHVDSSALVFSLSSHRSSFLRLFFSSRFLDS